MAARADGSNPPPNKYVTAASTAKAQAATDDGGGSPGPAYNSNVRPVVVGVAPDVTSSISRMPDRVDPIPEYRPNVSTVFDGMQVLSDLRANDPNQYQQLLNQLRGAGYLGARANSTTSIETAWGNVLNDAAAVYERDRQDPNANVFQFLASRVAAGPTPTGRRTGGGGGGSSAYNGPVARTDLTNEFDAEVVLNQALSNYLGRAAKDSEVAAFKQKLNATEASNPTVSTPVGHNAVTSGGVNPQQVAKEFAMGQSDYAETQASTTLMGWLTEAVAGSKNERIV